MIVKSTHAVPVQLTQTVQI